MALVNCPSCGATVSDQASKCPKCGSPMFVNPKQPTSQNPQRANYTSAPPVPVNTPNQGNAQVNNQNLAPQQQYPQHPQSYQQQGYNPQQQYNQAYSANPQQNMQQPSSGKNKTTFAVLALLLGWLGIQYFYVGKSIAGIIFIVASCTGIGTIFTVIMSLVQFIKGLTMTQQEFERTYVYTEKQFPLL